MGFNVWHGETLLNPPHCSLPYEAQYLKSKKDVCLIHKFITSQNDALNERGHALIRNADFRKEVLIFKMSFDGLPITPHPPACLPRPLAFSVVSLSLLEMGGHAALSLSASLFHSHFLSHTTYILLLSWSVCLYMYVCDYVAACTCVCMIYFFLFLDYAHMQLSLLLRTRQYRYSLFHQPWLIFISLALRNSALTSVSAWGQFIRLVAKDCLCLILFIKDFLRCASH